MNKIKMMKRLIMFIFLSVALMSQTMTVAQQKGKLRVEIKSFRSNEGKVTIALHNGPDGFPGGPENMLTGKAVEIVNGKAVAEFDEIPYGEYAVSAFHDENDNSELDTNWIGIPKEGIGTSNNAKGRMGPPKYEDAKFNFDSDGQKVVFDMGYF